MHNFIKITDSNNQVRLDKFIKNQFSISNALVQKFIRKGQVKVNGKKVKYDYVLQSDDELKVYVPKEAPKSSREANKILCEQLLSLIKQSIIFKDENIIAINKPYDVAVQGGTKIKISIADILENLKFDAEEVPKLVHRLDANTTGVLILARTKLVAQKLNNALKNRKIIKKYLAILHGRVKVKSGTIKTTTEDQGALKKSVTEYRVVKTIGSKLSLVEFIPTTGRKHQIRIHAAHELNSPILGDVRYAKREDIEDNKTIDGKMFLHANEVVIDAGIISKQSYEFRAELPKHIKSMLQ